MINCLVNIGVDNSEQNCIEYTTVMTVWYTEGAERLTEEILSGSPHQSPVSWPEKSGELEKLRKMWKME